MEWLMSATQPLRVKSRPGSLESLPTQNKPLPEILICHYTKFSSWFQVHFSKELVSTWVAFDKQSHLACKNCPFCLTRWRKSVREAGSSVRFSFSFSSWAEQFKPTSSRRKNSSSSPAFMGAFLFLAGTCHQVGDILPYFTGAWIDIHAPAKGSALYFFFLKTYYLAMCFFTQQDIWGDLFIPQKSTLSYLSHIWN